MKEIISEVTVNLNDFAEDVAEYLDEKDIIEFVLRCVPDEEVAAKVIEELVKKYEQ